MKFTIIKLKNNFIHSISGLRYALSEHSFRVELVVGFILLPILIVIRCPIELKLLLLFSYLLILICELLNTAIEGLCNRITQEEDPQIKVIKDIASAAVFIAVLLFLGILISFAYECLM